jgi:hypothetical protein
LKITKENTISKETNVKYDGTKGFCQGGNCADAKAGEEKHDGLYAKGEKPTKAHP